MISDKKLKEYRHEVMKKHNNLDIFISAIICICYFPGFPIPQGFFSNVLYQNPLSYSSRVNMLRNIFKERGIYNKSFFKKLEDLGTSRNHFAHSEMVILTPTGEEKIYNPKNWSEEIDFDKEYKSYIENESEVIQELKIIYESLGGVFQAGKPTNVPPQK